MAARKGNPGYADRRVLSPLERFLSFCRFDPGTGCVIWTGGTTSGRGHSAPYGSFWFEGRRWFAHRWAAKYVHGHDIDGLQVDHWCSEHCPTMDAPNTLCVEHVRPETPHRNRELQTLRSRERVEQDLETRRLWIHAQVGLIAPPPVCLEAFVDPPFYSAPAWLEAA